MRDPRERPMTADELAGAFASAREHMPSGDLRERILKAATHTPDAPVRQRWRFALLHAAAAAIGFLSVWGLERHLARDETNVPAHELLTLQTAAELIHGSDHTETRLLLALANLAERASAAETRTGTDDTRESRR